MPRSFYHRNLERGRFKTGANLTENFWDKVPSYIGSVLTFQDVTGRHFKKKQEHKKNKDTRHYTDPLAYGAVPNINHERVSTTTADNIRNPSRHSPLTRCSSLHGGARKSTTIHSTPARLPPCHPLASRSLSQGSQSILSPQRTWSRQDRGRSKCVTPLWSRPSVPNATARMEPTPRSNNSTVRFTPWLRSLSESQLSASAQRLPSWTSAMSDIATVTSRCASLDLLMCFSEFSLCLSDTYTHLSHAFQAQLSISCEGRLHCAGGSAQLPELREHRPPLPEVRSSLTSSHPF